MKGYLFTQYFLTDGIRTTPEWEAATPKAADFRRDLASAYERFRSRRQPNEAVTEQDFIRNSSITACCPPCARTTR